MTTQFSPSDIEYAIDTAYLLEEAHRRMTASLLGELRLRLDGLGLTPKGRRNLRWRPAETGADDPPRAPADLDRHRQRRKRLLAVDTKGVRQ